MQHRNFSFKQFIVTTLITSVWIHISEVFRYFVFVMPRVQAFFENQEGVAEMNLSIFSIWGLWDTLLSGILVFIFWLYSRVFGDGFRSILVSGTIAWLAVFVIFWVATANMGLSSWNILFITLSLSWLEMIIGAWVASQLYATNRWVLNNND